MVLVSLFLEILAYTACGRDGELAPASWQGIMTLATTLA